MQTLGWRKGAMEVSNVTTLGLLHFFKFLLDNFLIKINSDSLS